MKTTRGITVFCVLAVIAGDCGAQNPQVLPPPPPTPTVTLNSSDTTGSTTGAVKIQPGGPLVTLQATDTPLAEVIKDLASQSKMTLWVEPGVQTKVTSTFNKQPLEGVLNSLTESNNLVWAKVAILQPENAKLDPAPLFELVRAFRAVPSKEMTVTLDQGAGTVLVSRGGINAGPTTAAPAGQQRIIGYALAKKSSGGGLPEGVSTEGTLGTYNATTQQRMELLQQMAPADRQKAMQDELLMQLNMSPEARMQMMMDRRAAWQNMPQDLRQQLRDSMRQTRQQMGLPPGRGNRGNRGNRQQ
jgi:hypothetical protein